jgi:hypothetical protein
MPGCCRAAWDQSREDAAAGDAVPRSEVAHWCVVPMSSIFARVNLRILLGTAGSSVYSVASPAIAQTMEGHAVLESGVSRAACARPAQSVRR